MSRYSLQFPGGEVAYGFDHACGPFLQVFLNTDMDEPAEDHTYAFDPSFDCHALAQALMTSFSIS